MIIFDVLLATLCLYLIIYCIYHLIFTIKANKIEHFFDMQEKTRSLSLNKNKLCVIIYAHKKYKNLDNLLQALNNQSYDKENYEVHVVYQRDETDNSQVRDCAYSARIHNIQNPDYFTKDKAVNLFIQKLLEENKFDAYVFLGANRIVGEKYLENINRSIASQGVLVGSTVTINERNQIAKKIKNTIISSYLKYKNRTYSLVRSMFDLPCKIDGDNFVITSDVLEKMGYVGLEDKNSQLEFSFDLASNNIKSIFNPYIITGIDIKNYDFSSPDLKTKLNLFSHYFSLLIFKNFAFREFLFFLLRPNSLIVIFLYLILLFTYLYYPLHVIEPCFYVVSVFLLFNLIFSIKTSKMSLKEICSLSLYPICLCWQKLKLLINRLTMRSILESKYEEENINSATIPSVVSNGKKNINCKIDLVSEDGMRKAIYREGSRFISTDSFLRMFDALEDMFKKLKIRGLILKTCQNCENFTMEPDGTLDCLNGKCKISNNEILIWNGCQYFQLHHSKQNKEYE